MYHAFIRRTVARAFDDLGAARVDRHAGRFAEDARLAVDRAGERRDFHGREAIRAGLEAEFPHPGAHDFELREILVAGWPARTRIAVLWRDAPRGGPTRHGMNLIVLRWGRVVEEHLFAGAPEPQAANGSTG